MANFISKFTNGDSVWFDINGATGVACVHSVTFSNNGTITYGLHNENYPWPISYMEIPEEGLEPYID